MVTYTYLLAMEDQHSRMVVTHRTRKYQRLTYGPFLGSESKLFTGDTSERQSFTRNDSHSPGVLCILTLTNLSIQNAKQLNSLKPSNKPGKTTTRQLPTKMPHVHPTTFRLTEDVNISENLIGFNKMVLKCTHILYERSLLKHDMRHWYVKIQII